MIDQWTFHISSPGWFDINLSWQCIVLLAVCIAGCWALERWLSNG